MEQDAGVRAFDPANQRSFYGVQNQSFKSCQSCPKEMLSAESGHPEYPGKAGAFVSGHHGSLYSCAQGDARQCPESTG